MPRIIVSIVLAALVGTLVVALSKAATPVASFEAENGMLSGAAPVSDAAASNGAAVKFAPAQTGTRSCPPFPAFPDTSCTGVPAGTSLTTVNGSLSTSANGQTIDARLITGELSIGHDNVTVKNSRIKGRVALNGHTGIVLQDVDLGPDACAAGSGNFESINGSGYSLIRTHVHHNNADLIRLGGSQPILIKDSLLDSTCFYAGDHLDAVQWYDPGGVGSVTINHSSIDVRPVNNTGKGNAAIFWADNPGSGTTLTVFNSRLAGGGYTTAFYDASAGSGVVIDAHDNVYVKDSFSFGPCSSSASVAFNGTDGLKFTNNKLDDGTAISC